MCASPFQEFRYFNLFHFKKELFELQKVLSAWFLRFDFPSPEPKYFSEVLDCYRRSDFWNFRTLLETDLRFDALKEEFAAVIEKNNPFIFKELQFSPEMRGWNY